MTVKMVDGITKRDNPKSYSDSASKRLSEVKHNVKTKKERSSGPPSKVVVRRLPPTMTEEEFIESVTPMPEYDFFSFIPSDGSLGTSNSFCRAYINFKSQADIFTFRDKFDGYVFVDKKGNEYPAVVEFAPFQKIPRRGGSKKKDARCATIDQDPDYLAFLESLENPETITLQPLEAVLEEIQAYDRELKANNGCLKVKTPLLEYIEQRKAEKLRSKEEKREERRRKEFERKKAKEEEKRKKREVKEHKDMKKRDDHKEDISAMKLQVLQPERGKEDGTGGGGNRGDTRLTRKERERDRYEKEKQRRIEEDYQRREREKEKVKFNRKDKEKEREERMRKQEEKFRMREEERIRYKEEGREERNRYRDGREDWVRYKEDGREERIRYKEEGRARYRDEGREERSRYKEEVKEEGKRYKEEGRVKYKEEGREERMKSKEEGREERIKSKEEGREEGKRYKEDEREEGIVLKEEGKDDQIIHREDREEPNKLKEERKEEQHKYRDDEGTKEGSSRTYRTDVIKSKRYSEGRKKEEKDRRVKEDRGKKKEEESVPTPSTETEGKPKVEQETKEKEEPETNKEGNEGTQERATSLKKKEKDPRVERRIRNKDRPSMALYRPGQSRLSSRLRHEREEGAETSSSSPSPVMVEAKKLTGSSMKQETTNSQKTSSKELPGPPEARPNSTDGVPLDADPAPPTSQSSQRDIDGDSECPNRLKGALTRGNSR